MFGTAAESIHKRNRRRRGRVPVLAAAAVALALGLAACSSSGASGSASSTSAGGASSVSAKPTSSAVSTKFMTSPSSKSFDDTVSALKSSVSSNGLMVLGELDQAKALSITGLHVAGAHAFFVGSPTTGKMFFSVDPAIGAVVPIRMYVWQDQSKKVNIGYFDPAGMFTGVNAKLADSGKKISMMAAKITQGATGEAPKSRASVSTTFITVPSSKSFDDTVSALKSSVSSNGLMVLGELNQAKALSITGLHLKGAHSFFVGAPTTGKMFFSVDPAIGAVIPVQMYVWVDQAGQVNVGYFDPAPMFSALNPKLVDGGKKISMMAAKIAQGAT